MLGDLLPASAPGVERYQLIWDQLLARGWIVEHYIGQTYSLFSDLTGGYDFDLLMRVPKTSHCIPVRAVFHKTWPRLSKWLWNTKPRDRYTDEFEARLIRLLQQRKTVKDQFPHMGVDKEIANLKARTDKALRHAYVERELIKTASNHDHDWRITKGVRAR